MTDLTSDLLVVLGIAVAIIIAISGALIKWWGDFRALRASIPPNLESRLAKIEAHISIHEGQRPSPAIVVQTTTESAELRTEPANLRSEVEE